jgi:hypothetical protein
MFGVKFNGSSDAYNVSVNDPRTLCFPVRRKAYHRVEAFFPEATAALEAQREHITRLK